MKLLSIVGARPQFVKAAVLSREIARRNEQEEKPWEDILVHTGQHFDGRMSDIFFSDLAIPPPRHNLGIHGLAHGAMTGRMLEAIEDVLTGDSPDAVIVYGDTNSTLAGALAAVKLHIPVVHIEAGLRSFNRLMPEEINRVVTDHVADLLFAPTETAVANLAREGVPAERVVRTGDVMYDAVLHFSRLADTRSRVLQELALAPGSYAVATVHRSENTDNPDRLRGIFAGLADVAGQLPVILPLHPRTRGALDAAGITGQWPGELRFVDPLGYIDMQMLVRHASLVLTDSGGLQKEAFFHHVPCITLRDETEWVELVEVGANHLAGADRVRIRELAAAHVGTPPPDAPLYGDGRAGEQVLAAIARRVRE